MTERRARLRDQHTRRRLMGAGQRDRPQAERVEAAGIVDNGGSDGVALMDDSEQGREMSARLAAAQAVLADGGAAESPAGVFGRAVLALTEAQHAAVLLRSPTGFVTCPWHHDLPEAYVTDLVTGKDENPWAHIVRHPELACMDLPKGPRSPGPEPWLLSDIRELPSTHAVLGTWAKQENIRAIHSWPMIRAGRVIGAVVCYYDEPHVCSTAEQDVLRSFVTQAAQAVDLRSARAGRQSPADAEAASAGRVDSSSAAPHVNVRPLIVAQHGSDASEERKHLGEAQAVLATEKAALADAQRELQMETLRVANAHHELTDEAARLAEVRKSLDDQRARLSDREGKLTASEATLVRDRTLLEEEKARITATERELEAAQAELRRATAGLEDDKRRLAEARRALEDEQARLAADRAAHAAARPADSPREPAERERLAEKERQLTAEAARLAHEREALEAMRADVAARQTKLTAAEAALSHDRDALNAEATRISAARQAWEATQAAPPRESAVKTRPQQPAATPRKTKADQALPAESDANAGGDPPPEEAQAADAPAAPAPQAPQTTFAMILERAGAQKAKNLDDRLVAVAQLLDRRAGLAAGYSKRLAGWAEGLGRALACPEKETLAVRRAALLHDIGKIDVPEATLSKVVDLTTDEKAMLGLQPVVAHELLKDVDGLAEVAVILRHRFEQWGGAGYPDRLKGNAIPIGARILAIVEAYAEMNLGRPGVAKLYIRDTIAALKRAAGTQFDPTIANQFCETIASG